MSKETIHLYASAEEHLDILESKLKKLEQDSEDLIETITTCGLTHEKRIEELEEFVDLVGPWLERTIKLRNFFNTKETPLTGDFLDKVYTKLKQIQNKE